MVNDFGICYSDEDNMQHLLKGFKSKYKVTVDKLVSLCYGASLEWTFRLGQVRCSMPKFVPKFLELLKYPAPEKQKFSPRPAPEITHGTKMHKEIEQCDSLPLSQNNNSLVWIIT